MSRQTGSRLRTTLPCYASVQSKPTLNSTGNQSNNKGNEPKIIVYLALKKESVTDRQR